ncbi:hypothetical protein IPM62_04965 [Candidatus Woesebacteria bacterium]|nr:MAG: hypothetical protein IPM62_04965 [Candidatus Woesebacteria bacterium]
MSHIFFKTTWSYIRRSPFQALAAIFVLANTFFVVTVLAISVYSSEKAISYYETRPQVIAFLKDEAPFEEVTLLQDTLLRDVNVKNVKYVSKEEALGIYKEATSDNPLLSELVSPSIFPASIEFSVADLSYLGDIIAKVETEAIVEEVGYSASLPGGQSISDVVDNLKNITNYIRLGGGVFVSIQLISSFLVLIVIIMMRLSVRKTEIEILNLIGATKGFIRNPIILEALFYAIIGVLTGWITALLIVLYATPSIIRYFGEIPVLPRDTISLMSVFGVILAGELIIGITLALTGSVFAVSRASRKRR